MKKIKSIRNKRFICIIPARSGSKGIKNKNIKIIGGKPLIYWTINAAIKSKFFSKVIVSTDSPQIKRLVKINVFVIQSYILNKSRKLSYLIQFIIITVGHLFLSLFIIFLRKQSILV